MTKFLSDYGLKWVGGEGGQREGQFDSAAINKELDFQAPQYRSNLPKEIDTDVLQRRIEELNFIAEKQRMVTMRPGMKGFKVHDDVPIFFFANGLMIKGFNFYPYYSKQAQVSDKRVLYCALECVERYFGRLLPLRSQEKVSRRCASKTC